jgi:hypothetical protein
MGEPQHNAIDIVRGIIDAALEVATDPDLSDRQRTLGRRLVEDAKDLLEDLDAGRIGDHSVLTLVASPSSTVTS